MCRKGIAICKAILVSPSTTCSITTHHALCAYALAGLLIGSGSRHVFTPFGGFRCKVNPKNRSAFHVHPNQNVEPWEFLQGGVPL